MKIFQKAKSGLLIMRRIELYYGKDLINWGLLLYFIIEETIFPLNKLNISFGKKVRV